MAMHAWQNLADDGSVRWLKYSFGPGTANTLAARLDDGTWMLVSPSCGSAEADCAGLGEGAKVSVLVAPNGFHHMGQKAWRERFPDAVSYAAPGAIDRLNKKSAGIDYRPLSELGAKLPPRIKVIAPKGQKRPDLLVCVESGATTAWYVGDLISNTTKADLKPVPRAIFGLLGGGTGYRYNRVPAIVYLSDKKAWKDDVKAALQAHPPTTVLPAHGDPVTEDAAARTQAILS